MADFTCMIVFVFLLPVVMISLGLIYIFRKDWAWRIAESMLKSVNPQRTREWERYSTINGVVLLVFGVLIIGFLVQQLLVD